MLSNGALTKILPVLIVPTRQRFATLHRDQSVYDVCAECHLTHAQCAKCKISVKQAIRDSYHRALEVGCLCKSFRVANCIAGVCDFHIPGKLFRTFGKLGSRGIFSNSFNVFFQEAPI